MYIKKLTLAELLIAIVCLSLLITYGIQEFTGSAIQLDKMAKYDKGVLYAVDAIEICKSWPFDRLDEDDAPTGKEKNYLEHAFNDTANKYDPAKPDECQVWHTTVFDQYNYERNVDIKNVDSTNAKIKLKLKIITVIIKWWPVGKSKSNAAAYEISTVIGK